MRMVVFIPWMAFGKGLQEVLYPLMEVCPGVLPYFLDFSSLVMQPFLSCVWSLSVAAGLFTWVALVIWLP